MPEEWPAVRRTAAYPESRFLLFPSFRPRIGVRDRLQPESRRKYTGPRIKSGVTERENTGMFLSRAGFSEAQPRVFSASDVLLRNKQGSSGSSVPLILLTLSFRGRLIQPGHFIQGQGKRKAAFRIIKIAFFCYLLQYF